MVLGLESACDYECGMHLWDDFIYFEVVDPKTGKNLPDGEVGELVITTLRKQGAPLIRYRTRPDADSIRRMSLREPLSPNRYDSGPHGRYGKSERR